MSTRSKLLAKTGDLQLPPDDAPNPVSSDHAETSDLSATRPPIQPPQIVPGASPRTGPGQMLQFRGQMLAVEGELAKLRERLQQHDGSLPTRKLDPQSIVPSPWANRHPDAFKSSEFERLKRDIELAGGNVQPICVRPVAGSSTRYEIVFGHRRHQACSELGLPVLATIVDAPISDRDLFSAMDRENRERADLSPYEQGMMYRRALDAGLYPSNRRLAEALGVSHTWVANVLQVAELPPAILECFKSPIEVQHRHARVIAAALDQDRKTVLRRAEKLRQAAVKPAPSAVIAALLKGSEQAETRTNSQTIAVGGKPAGTWFRDTAGRVNIQLAADIVPEDRLHAVLQQFAKLLEQ